MRVSFLTKIITILLLIHVIASENILSNNDKRGMDEQKSLCVYTKFAEWPASYQSQKLTSKKADAKLRHDLAFNCGGNLTANDSPNDWPCCSCGASCPDNLVDAACSCGSKDTSAQTKYPVVFAPSRMALPSMIDPTLRFGGLLEYLPARGGALVYNTTTLYNTTTQCESLASCADEFLTQVKQILAASGAAKVNIIAHLDAGLYARKAVAIRPDLFSSLTTINTPHYGTPLFDHEGTGKSIASELGIEESYALELTTQYVTNVFNPLYPQGAVAFTVNGVYYQSFSSTVDRVWTPSTKKFLSEVTGEKVKRPDTVKMSRLSDIKYSPLLANTAWLIPEDNDGISSVSSQKWGNFRGNVSTAFDYATGIDAFQVINDSYSGQDFWSVKLFYLNLLADLKNRGF